MELRPYQKEAVSAITTKWGEGTQKLLLVLPTGTGKTIVFAKVAEGRVKQGDRVLILAHRGELLDQASDKIKTATGLGTSLEKAESSCLGSWYRIAVGSVQSLQQEKRLSQFPPDYFDTIIVDEAHHVLSDSYLRVLNHFPDAKILGVTATPDRGDMRNLGAVFQDIAYEYKLPQAIKDGYLCRIVAETIPLKLDISGVSMQNGDFKASEIGSALDPYLDQISDIIAERCKGRKTVVFLPLIKTSERLRDLLIKRHRIAAAEVNGSSNDRAELLSRFERGEVDVLCNSMLLTEGWDCPSVDTIIVLRPTKIRSLYAQMVGRGTRLSPGKDHLLLLDFLWHTERHELCHPASLICESEETAKAVTSRLEKTEGGMDLEAALTLGQQDVLQQREEALAKKLAEMRHRKHKLVDPLQFEMSIQSEDLAEYVPAFGYQMGPVTDVQRQALERAGINPDEIECAGKASLILDKLRKRREAGLTTPKQIRFLESRYFRNVGTWTFDDAKRLIDRFAANNWRLPPGINPATYVPDSRRNVW